MLKIFKNAAVFLIFSCSSLHADESDCQLASPINSVIDLRDGGVGFAYGTTPTLVSTQAITGGSCELQLRATNLPAPRSKIYQEFRDPLEIQYFNQEIKISNITLRGAGELKFMSIEFDSFGSSTSGGSTSRLDLYIIPEALLKGRGYTEGYRIRGAWNNFDTDGVSLPGSYFYTPILSQSQVINLKWQYRDYGMYDGMNLELDLNNGTILPIITYPQTGVPWGASWGQPRFYPTGKTLGSLSQTSLVPQSSFLLHTESRCIRILGAINQNSCD